MSALRFSVELGWRLDDREDPARSWQRVAAFDSAYDAADFARTCVRTQAEFPGRQDRVRVLSGRRVVWTSLPGQRFEDLRGFDLAGVIDPRTVAARSRVLAEIAARTAAEAQP